MNGTKILSEAWQDNLLLYIYDESGSPVGFMYRNSSYAEDEFDTYFYEKNLQGDIVAIYNEAGTKLISYYYDAWGNARTVCSNSGASTTATYNPFKYRGYYQDETTGFYYLNSRYYDPILGRFINPDDISYLGSDGSLTGYNLYAYCGNNPVNLVDPSGYFPWLVLAAILLFTPLGGTALQITTSAVCYVGMAIASIFDEDIRNDMNEIGWNPFNADESATLKSSKVSFYKGVPVFRTSSRGRSGSFGAIMLTKGSGVDDLRHERGHNWQLMMMGIANYGLMIGLPSWQEWSDRSYYERPWEVTADVLGGVTGRHHNQADINRGYWYLGVSALLGPFGYLFLFGEY